MEFAFSDEQEMIRESAEGFLADVSDSAAVRAAMVSERGFDEALWQRLCREMYWPAIHIPEAYGGLGLGFVELGILLEQMGRRLLCSPFFATACMATPALLLAADDQQKQRWLPLIADGSVTAALAFSSANGRAAEDVQATVVKEGDGFVLDGTLNHVLDGHGADLLIIAARLPGSVGEAGISLFAVEADQPGIERQMLPTMDQTRRQARIRLNGVYLDAQCLLGEFGAGWPYLERVLQLACIALACEQTGGAQQVLDLSVAYMQERQQFGRPIASFQALKHRAADMMLQVECARSASYYAACVAQEVLDPEGDPQVADELPTAAALAKAHCSDTFFHCASEAIQLHGGVGFTWEYDVHLYFKRARASESFLGLPAWHLERIAEAILGEAAMKISFSEHDERFRQEVADWLRVNLSGEFEALRFRGGPGDEHMFPEERKAWERKLAEGGWTCVGWAPEHGGRGLSITQQVIFHEEYARAGGPGRMGHIGEGLAGPTIAAFGSAEQQRRFLPGIVNGTAFWCQGYSEPGAGSDLANVKTRATLDQDSGSWIINGQKVWTSLAHESDWCFVLARTEPGSVGHRGLSFLLVPMAQAEITVRPIEQLTGTSEFNEVFFDDARTEAANIVGLPGEGWKIAMALLGFERGVSTLGQQMQFHNELNEIIGIARANGAARDPVLRQRLAQAWSGLRIMRYNSLRMLSGAQDGSLRKEATIYKLFWSTWHASLGKLAMDVLGADAELLEAGPYQLTRLQSLYLFSRADTLYGGSNEIQRNIIAERALGMPKEPRLPV